MNAGHEPKKPDTDMNLRNELPGIFRAIVLDSPVCTWVADSDGTLIFENAASRAVFGIEQDDQVVGKYNIFRDEEIIREGLAPTIREVFENGGSTEYSLDYDFLQVSKLTGAHPAHKYLRVFVFAIKSSEENLNCVVFQPMDVTERHRAQVALAQSQAQYKALVEYTSDWVWEIDLEGRYTFSNSVVEQVLGFTPEEVVGRPAFDFICPEDHERMQNTIAKAISRREGFKAIVHRMRHQDGSTRVIESSGKPIIDSDGNLLGFRGIDRDVTRRVQAEQALKESEARLRSFVDNIPFDVWALDRDNRYILENPTAAAHWGDLIGKTIEELDVPMDVKEKWLENNARALAGETVRVEVGYHVGGECRTFDSLIAPIARDHEIIGTLGINFDITKRKQAEHALADAEAKYRSLVEKSLVGVYIIQDGKLSYVNPRLAQIFGYDSPSELEGRSVLDTVVPEDRATATENIRKRIAGETNTIRYRFTGVRKDGSRIVVEVLGSRDVYHGKPAVIGSLLDITQRVEAETQLRASEAELRALISAMPDVIFVLDADGTYLKIPPTNPDLLYRPSEELLGKTLKEVFPEDQADRFLNAVRAALRTEKTQHLEYALTIRGREFWFSASISPMDDKVVWVARDITEQKHAQEAVRQSEENFRAIFNYAPALIVTYDRNAVVVEVNQAFERFSGYTREELVGRSMFETFAKPEVLEHKHDVIGQVFAGETVRDQEWVAVRPDGTRVYALANTTPVYDSTGNVSKALSMGVDITERKQAEQAQRDLEQHKREFYRRTILAATEGKLVIAERDEIERVAGPPVKSWDIVSGEELGVVRQDVMDVARSVGMDEARIYDFVLAVGEMSTNALKHAGGGHASLHKPDDELIFVVSDRGPGIEAVTLPEVALVRGYSTAGTLGMGYKAVLSVADRVYLATSPSGTTVAVEMKLHKLEQEKIGANLPDTWMMQR